MTERAVDIFDRPRKQCSGCEHWNIYHTISNAGYLESMCQKDDDIRDHEVRRASDYCSMWKGR